MKVLSWNVAGVVFVTLVSSVEDLEPGMTDFFHVGELILGPQLTDDLNDFMNDFMSASAAHMTVTNTWMNTHTHTLNWNFPQSLFSGLNTVLCGGNGKTSVQKLWVIEQIYLVELVWIQMTQKPECKQGIIGGLDGSFDGLASIDGSLRRLAPMAFDGGSDGSGGGVDGFVGLDGGDAGLA